MIRSVRIIAAAVVLIALAGPAHATYCPGLMASIDDALQTASDLSPEQVDKIKRLRDEGDALHRNGNHSESIAMFKKALKLLKQK